MAIVLDENQVVSGIVTVEDLMEEIVGEIYDESDRDVSAVRREGPDSYLLPGSFPVHDLEDLGIEVPEGPYTTVAGLLIERLGGLPERRGSDAEVAGWRFEVVSFRRRRIRGVRVTKAQD